MGFLSVLSQAQRWVKERVHAGEFAVDATAGNGSDTLFLARAVGPEGAVFAFDVQAEALESTRARLEAEAGKGDLANVSLIHEGHERMEITLPGELHGRIAAIMFNLGYLPGGASSSVITQPASTLAALEASLRLLRSGGILTVVVYPGHEGGQTEADAVSAWSEAVSPALAQSVVYRFPQKTASPFLIALNKK